MPIASPEQPARTSHTLGIALALALLVALALALTGAVLEATRGGSGMPRMQPAPAAASVASVDSPVGRALDLKTMRTRQMEKVALGITWAVLASTMFLLGVVVFVLMIVPVAHDEEPPLARGDPVGRVVRGAAVIAVIGSIVLLFLRTGVESDRAWNGMFDRGALLVVTGSSFGASAFFRIAGVLFALGLLIAPLHTYRRPVVIARGGFSVIGAITVSAAAKRRVAGVGALVVCLASCAMVGHAQASEPRALLIVADMAHVAAGSVWFGGVAMLALTLRQARRDDGAVPVLGPLLAGESARRRLARTVGRFSVAAMLSVAAVSIAGAALAWSQLKTVDALFSTPYGITMLIKLGCVGFVMAVGGFNHRFVVPKILRDEGDGKAWARLRRAVILEAGVIGGGVLVATAALAGGGFARWFG